MIESNMAQQTDFQKAITGSTNYLGPKPWDELTADERIELLRQELRAWRDFSSRLMERLSILEGHQHGNNGEILIQLHQANRTQGVCGTFDRLR